MNADSWAQPSAEQYKQAILKTSEGEVNLEGYGEVESYNSIYKTSCFLTGTIDGNPDYCPKPPGTVDGGLLMQSTKLVSALYENPPASSGEWIADVSYNLGFAKPSYAQGIGFSALSPLLSLWKVMRNIAYALIIIVLLVIGLMVMFRAKIDPRTVISIQSALPRIVMTLILITFSYPIAGLMIDLMYLVLFLGISLVGPVPPGTQAGVAQMQADFANGGGLGRIYASIPNITVAMGAIIGPFFAGLGASGVIGSQFLGLAALGSGIAVTLVFLLIAVAFIFAVIRIFFILLNSYIQILIAVIFAPILLLGQAIPGQSSFSNWIKNLLANLSVFPVTAILIIVADIVSRSFSGGSVGIETPTSTWVPPIIGGRGSFFAATLIPLGFALAIPQLVLTIKKAFGAKPIAPVGGSVARAFGQPVGIIQQTIGTLGSIRLLRGGPGGGRPG